MQNPRKLLIFPSVLKSDMLDLGVLKRRNIWNFHPFEWSSFEPWGIYDYQVIKQNVNQGYLGTDYNELFVLVQFDLQYWNVVKHKKMKSILPTKFFL